MRPLESFQKDNAFLIYEVSWVLMDMGSLNEYRWPLYTSLYFYACNPYVLHSQRGIYCVLASLTFVSYSPCKRSPSCASTGGIEFVIISWIILSDKLNSELLKIISHHLGARIDKSMSQGFKADSKQSIQV